VNVFPHGGGVVIALTYGRDVDWVRNVMAEGGCGLIHRGRVFELVRPRVVPLGDVAQDIPNTIRGILRLLGVTQALRLAPVPPAGQ
jgi:hypothetical protein